MAGYCEDYDQKGMGMDTLISDAGISQVGLAFFLALIGMVTALFKKVSDNLNEARETRKVANDVNQAAILAKESADAAVANTKNVSNGFASRVLGELCEIREGQAELSAQLARHFEWHLNQEKEEKK